MGRPGVLILDRPHLIDDTRARIRAAAAEESAVILSSSRPDEAAEIAESVAILARGRLLWTGPVEELGERFRRIRYVTHVTESRNGAGSELDEFDAIRVRVRGWGIEAIVSNFDAAALQTLGTHGHVSEVASEPVSLAEIVEATRSEGD